jgi:gluconate 5-dehydrogenase
LDLDISRIQDLTQDYPDRLLALECDVRSEGEITSAVLESVQKFGPLDIAVHNACICTFDAMEDTDLKTYRDVMDVNFFGALRLARAVVPKMAEAGRGKMIFVSSGVGVTGFYNISPYASSKGAIESLAKSLSIEYQDKNVSFHLIHPPLTKTASSAPLPVPPEMMADPEAVGKGLAKRLNKKSFIITHSFVQQFQVRLSYLFPLYLGRLMTMMTKRAES